MTSSASPGLADLCTPEGRCFGEVWAVPPTKSRLCWVQHAERSTSLHHRGACCLTENQQEVVTRVAWRLPGPWCHQPRGAGPCVCILASARVLLLLLLLLRNWVVMAFGISHRCDTSCCHWALGDQLRSLTRPWARGENGQRPKVQILDPNTGLVHYPWVV